MEESEPAQDNVHVSTGQRETGTRRSTSPQAQHTDALLKSTTYPAFNLVLVPAAASPRRLSAAQARCNVAHVGGGYTVWLMAVRFRPQTRAARVKSDARVGPIPGHVLRYARVQRCGGGRAVGWTV